MIRLYEGAEKDPKIIGFFLGGFKGKGFVAQHSDYGTYMISQDGLVRSYIRILKEDLL